MPGQCEPSLKVGRIGLVEKVSLWLGALRGARTATASKCAEGVLMAAHTVSQQEEGQWSLHGRAELGLSGKWCPHQRKRRKQLEEEEPKRGRGQRATPLCAGGGKVSPVNLGI